VKVWTSLLKQFGQVFSSTQSTSLNQKKDECVPCTITLENAYTLTQVTLIRHQKPSIELPTYQLKAGDTIILKERHRKGVVIKYERRLNTHQKQTALMIISYNDWEDMEERDKILRKYSQRRAN